MRLLTIFDVRIRLSGRAGHELERARMGGQTEKKRKRERERETVRDGEKRLESVQKQQSSQPAQNWPLSLNTNYSTP